MAVLGEVDTVFMAWKDVTANADFMSQGKAHLHRNHRLLASRILQKEKKKKKKKEIGPPIGHLIA